ncbi:unnamed protein product [Mytilus edulis]|uniref:Uncharacterized protein n=1 Tax=Mytilus edulis TaxID=6550 RepID=A0A8S3S6W1_MYTED|nr:unnamed protein product [Mytilus edulis]
MRTSFGRHMTVVLTKVNDFHYINLYNNPRNPGRCFLGWDEFLELTNMKEGLEQLFKQFEAQQPQQLQTQQPQPPQIQQPQKPTLQELIPPPPLCAAQAIRVIGSSNNKRPSTLPRCGLSSKNKKGEENLIHGFFQPIRMTSSLPCTVNIGIVQNTTLELLETKAKTEVLLTEPKAQTDMEQKL